jgi:signal peptidase
MRLDSLWRFVLPITAAIVAGEIFRHVVRVQNNKIADILTYLALVAADICIGTGLGGINNFNNFMDFMGLTLFPAIVANVLYHYVSKQYGIYPNIVYRLLITLFVYVTPIIPAMPDSLFAFANLIIPIIIIVFISALYDKKRRNATEKKNRFTVPVTVLMLAVMLSMVMLISNQFAYGSVVIATDSMTGELNRGDATIYNRYDGEQITEGQIIVFEKDGSLIVHRVVDIYHINGETQYYTQGDANENIDEGYVTNNDIVGVVQMKIPYVGYPALWLRELFVQ